MHRNINLRSVCRRRLGCFSSEEAWRIQVLIPEQTRKSSFLQVRAIRRNRVVNVNLTVLSITSAVLCHQLQATGTSTRSTALVWIHSSPRSQHLTSYPWKPSRLFWILVLVLLKLLIRCAVRSEESWDSDLVTQFWWKHETVHRPPRCLSVCLVSGVWISKPRTTMTRTSIRPVA